MAIHSLLYQNQMLRIQVQLIQSSGSNFHLRLKINGLFYLVREKGSFKNTGAMSP